MTVGKSKCRLTLTTLIAFWVACIDGQPCQLKGGRSVNSVPTPVTHACAGGPSLPQPIHFWFILSSTSSWHTEQDSSRSTVPESPPFSLSTECLGPASSEVWGGLAVADPALTGSVVLVALSTLVFPLQTGQEEAGGVALHASQTILTGICDCGRGWGEFNRWMFMFYWYSLKTTLECLIDNLESSMMFDEETGNE